MTKSTRQLTLPNGLSILFACEWRRYFGDFHTVKVHVTCAVPLHADSFPSEEEYLNARDLLGHETTYLRSIQKTGVASTEIEPLLNRIIADFQRHSLPYFNAPDFCRKLAESHIKKLQKTGLNCRVMTRG